MTSPSHLLPTRCRFPEGGAPRGGRASPAALELHISASSSRSLYSSRASARATQRALEISSPLHGPKRDFVTLIHSDHLKLKTSGGCFFVFCFLICGSCCCSSSSSSSGTGSATPGLSEASACRNPGHRTLFPQERTVLWITLTRCLWLEYSTDITTISRPPVLSVQLSSMDNTSLTLR